MKSLADAGVRFECPRDDVELIPGPNFDPAKLEALR
jgi:cysteinyl-tRNA synthetase